MAINYYSTENACGAPVFVWGLDKSHGESAVELFEKVAALTDRDFSLAVFDVESWNAQFSPWPAAAVFGKDNFEGRGRETLSFLEKKVVGEIKPKFPESKIYLAGYSLAGLFSLWALYESDIFDGAACCSSSLWFEEWDEYVASRSIKSPARIYMSLGDREEVTKNKTMAKVGDRTRSQCELLEKDQNVLGFCFEWNCGGHFDQPLLRLAKGIASLAEK